MALIAIGVDLVEVARARRLLERHGARALQRLLTEEERAYVEGAPSAAESLAARLAAKEAAYKALAGTPASTRISWRDAEVTRAADGRVGLRFHGAAADVALALGVRQALLSISHERGMAVAVVALG